MFNILMLPYSVEEGVNYLRQVAIHFPNSNLPQVLDDLRRSIALALGIPEDYIAFANGSKETKDDHISTNPRYSKMLSMVQQSIAKGMRDTIYKHLTTRYTNSEGVLTQTVDKDKIEVLFKSSTNINNKLEEERLMLKIENMGNTVDLVDSIAASPNIPAKVKGDNFLQYWYAELEKNPFLRSIFEKMTPEEMRNQYGPDMEPNTGDESADAQGGEGDKKTAAEKPQKGEEVAQEPAEGGKQEVEQVVKQPQEAGTKEEQIIRNTFQ
jgi:hypothetical protein